MTQDEYEHRLKVFFESVGSNPGESHISKMGWYVTKVQEFRSRLVAEGYDLKGISASIPVLELTPGIRLSFDA